MSITSSIRKRSGVAVTIVALGLILFLVGGDILGPNSKITAYFRQKIGEIDGKSVTTTEYQESIQQKEADFQIQNNRNPGAEESNSIREQAWNQIFFDRVNKEEFEKLGIGVPDNERVDMVQGKNIHPYVRQAFTNPQTGEFNKDQVVQILKNISRAPAEQQRAWINFEEKLPEDRMRTKYEALLTKTNYVTRLEGLHEYMAANTKADVQYLFVNFSSIVDSTIKIDDKELEAYLSENANKYKVQDNRAIEYVEWVVKPSKEDSTAFQKELEGIRTEFATAQNDTVYAASQSDAPVKLATYTIEQLPAELGAEAANLQPGQVYGPFNAGGSYNLYKVISAGPEGDPSVKASHILFQPFVKAPAPGADTSKANARARALSVLKQIQGGAPFEIMAQIHGTDGTKTQGGDLGWFTREKMVKPFSDAVFAHSGTGLLPNLVETDFGYHIVKVTAPQTNVKYKVVSIVKNLNAGDKTRDDLYAAASEFRGNFETDNGTEFDNTVKKANLQKKEAASVYKNGTTVSDIPEARELIRWAYSEDTDIGELSDVFIMNDRYVVAKLIRKTAEGPAKLDDVREAVTNEVRKKKKAEQIIAKLGSGTLEQMQQRYGQNAILNTQTDLFLNANGITDFGYDPQAVGTIFGSKTGASKGPMQVESGVAAIKVLNLKDAPAVDKGYDVSSYKTQIEQKINGRTQYYIAEAMKDLTHTIDNRVRYY